MAGPCGCRDAGCGCCFIENADSEVPYNVFGYGGSGDCIKLNIKNIATTIATNANGTLTYTNETGATVTWYNGSHYSVDIAGELVSDLNIPNVVSNTFTATVGGALPLTVTLINPSTQRQMSVHTQGTGEEVFVVARTATPSQHIRVRSTYSINGGPEIPAKQLTGGDVAFPLSSGDTRCFNGYTAAPCFVGTVAPGGTWTISVQQRYYLLTAAMLAGWAARVQGQRITVSGSTTI